MLILLDQDQEDWYLQQALDQYLVRVPLVWEADPQLALQVELP